MKIMGNFFICRDLLTDHSHDVLDKFALIEQAVALSSVLLVDLVEGRLGGLVCGAVLLVLLTGIVCAVGRLLGLLHCQTEGGFTVQPGGERFLQRQFRQPPL